MTAAIHYRVAGALWVMGSLLISPCVRGDDSPPKELVQYVHNARTRGLTEARIREQAVQVGWPAVLVDKAISWEAGGKSSAEAADRGTEAAITKSSSEHVVPPALAGAAAGSGIGVPGGFDSRAGSDDYQIGAGDQLQISVWREPDVTVPSVVVRSDGKITVPLIKEVAVAGLTPRQAEKLISDGLAKYITDVNVTVVVATVNSKKIYLIGAVKKEGTLPYTYGMTVMQALSEAGGLTEYAKRKKIYILRTENGRDYRLEFNYDEVVRGERMEQNVVLLSGDTVVIPH